MVNNIQSHLSLMRMVSSLRVIIFRNNMSIHKKHLKSFHLPNLKKILISLLIKENYRLYIKQRWKKTITFWSVPNLLCAGDWLIQSHFILVLQQNNLLLIIPSISLSFFLSRAHQIFQHISNKSYDENKAPKKKTQKKINYTILLAKCSSYFISKSLNLRLRIVEIA